MNTQIGSAELWIKTVLKIVGKPTHDLHVIDLCCCEMTTSKQLGFTPENVIAVDVVDWPTRPKEYRFFQKDAYEFMRWIGKTSDERPDLILCSDGIEHFRKLRGYQLLAEMERVETLSIIFTPLGNMNADPKAVHPDAHKSAWYLEDFRAIGWEVEEFPNWHPTWNMGAFFAWKGKL